MTTKETIPSQKYGYENQELRKQFPNPPLRMIAHAVIATYMRVWHGLESDIATLPNQGPALILTHHTSYLDTVAHMVIDPYWRWTAVPVKKEIFEIPGIRNVLEAWGAFPVSRDGSDRAVIKTFDALFNEGRTVCIAPQGTRSRTGRLGPMDETAVGLTLHATRQGVPVYPIVVIGAYESLPPGRYFDLPYKISVKSGPQLDLSPFTDRSISLAIRSLAAAAHIQSSLADLLPDRNKPAPGTPTMWTKADYVNNRDRRY